MLHERMTTDDLFTALQALKDDKASDLINELLVHHLELEMQNRELLETQQQLAHSRTRYADLYDFSPIGYASLDENGFIEEINIIAGKLLGDNPHKLIGRPFSEFIATDEIQSFKDHLRRCRWSRKKRSIELQLVSQQSQPIDIQLFTMATQDADRHTLQFRTAMIDITIRKHAEAAVLETQKKLEQMVRERTAELTSERRQREDAQRFLYEASSVLAMSLDYEITLWTIARAGVPHLADACVVDMVQEDDSIKRVAVSHVEAGKQGGLWNTGEVQIGESVIRSGQPEFSEASMCVPLIV